ncbi:MAG: hypothetical protein AAGF99_04945 [Bacteroidota bacterium]
MLLGIGVALALLVGYAFLLRPLRQAYTAHVALPLLERVDTDRSARYALQLSPSRLRILAQARGEDAAPTDFALYDTPMGTVFLIPALVLALFFPTRPYWVYLALYHGLVALVTLLVFAVGLGWASVGFAVYRFGEAYLSESMSLAFPILLVFAARMRSTSTGTRRKPVPSPPRAG